MDDERVAIMYYVAFLILSVVFQIVRDGKEMHAKRDEKMQVQGR